ncbi:3-oxoadipate enol-lactonase [Plantactinospora sp. KLBMP9567]|uniref:3-oxoadipate enol-lactonase n=1 Tax=Plantactinospora sp. KLBMP9567 TaxID=3085900 RepID=UPI002981A515|nr:3-oxoadipate enol-lactonase [Plantactinospora sp. KLBMP9567]MDW5330286.1 3-oxoadipate enol-lactonase [Plantactinospora sp. KLBMP9567]
MPLAHEVTGPAGTPALLLGGSLGTTRTMWRPQVTALSQRMRVVVFDHRGHGRSPAPPGPYDIADLGNDVVDLLDHLNLDRVHYAGLSLGGMVGMWLAARHAERVDRLALLCTAAYLPPAGAWLSRAAQVRAHGTASLTDTLLGRWFTAGYADRHPDTVARLVTDLAASPAEGYAACCEAIAAMDLRPLLPEIASPTLVVAGADDPATPPREAQLITEAVPEARLAVLDRAAHLASVEQPARVTALLAEHFLEER